MNRSILCVISGLLSLILIISIIEVNSNSLIAGISFIFMTLMYYIGYLHKEVEIKDSYKSTIYGK